MYSKFQLRQIRWTQDGILFSLELADSNLEKIYRFHMRIDSPCEVVGKSTKQ